MDDPMEDARAFTAAAGAMLWTESDLPRRPSRPAIMFQWLYRGNSVGIDHIVEAAIDEESDAVFLEFDPGRVRAGPANIGVAMRSSERDVMIFPQCVLWTGDDGVTLLLPLAQDFTFAFDGYDLFLSDVPPGRRHRRGTEARREAAACLRRASPRIRGRLSTSPLARSADTSATTSN